MSDTLPFRAPEPASPAPRVYLASWYAILAALGLPSTGRQGRVCRELVRRFNHDYNGPIVMPGKGGQPRVEKTRLLAWWDDSTDSLRKNAISSRAPGRTSIL